MLHTRFMVKSLPVGGCVLARTSINLPETSPHHSKANLDTSDKDYTISKDPERHGIGGSSSGAIAAFTVAWERPDIFRKVLSNVGSFTNLRGGNAYADIVKKSKKKPIRIFMVDGRNDNRGQRNGGAY